MGQGDWAVLLSYAKRAEKGGKERKLASLATFCILQEHMEAFLEHLEPVLAGLGASRPLNEHKSALNRLLGP